MSGSQKKNDKNNSLTPGGSPSNANSNANSNASLANLISSPIPQFLYGSAASKSSSSTPESEVESSLAYKGTERYSAKSRQERKIKKKREAEQKKALEAQAAKENDASTKPSFITIDVKQFNDQFSQTETEENMDNDSNCSKLKKKKRKEKEVETRSVQTDMRWVDVRKLLPDNMYDLGVDGMKRLLYRLKLDLLGISHPIPFDGSSSSDDDDESEQSLTNLSSEADDADEEIPLSVDTCKHHGEERDGDGKDPPKDRSPENIQIQVIQENGEEIRENALEGGGSEPKGGDQSAIDGRLEDIRLASTSTPTTLAESFMKKKASVKNEEAFSRRKSSSPRLEHRMKDEQDGGGKEVAAVLSEESKKKKVTTQSDEPPKKTTKTVVPTKKARRVSSAHAYGRDSFQPGGGNIVDIFKANGAKARAEEPQILKYVGEKEDITPNVDATSITGWLEGLCQFCGNQLLPMPTFEDLVDPEVADSIQYCCREFKYFVSLQLMVTPHESKTDEKIDIAPSAPYGVKSNRKAARERLVDRQRERELERQKAAAQQANLFSFARQMKTIQYSLASKKYLNEGWTVIPTSPEPPELRCHENEFHIEVNSTLLQSSGVWIDKKYDNGNPFLHIFPDGTGCCYYPSGNVAVMITAVEKQRYTYIVQSNKHYDDLDEVDDNGLLAIFEANGNSVCYYRNEQRIRTFINTQGGMELDPLGQKKKRWQWYFIQGHVHTPPFHPLCFTLNKYISVRVLDQNNIALTFSSHKRNVRFNVGANVKASRIRGKFAGDESEDFLNDKRKEISSIMRNIHEALRLPKSVRDGPFPTPAQRKALKSRPLPPIDDKKMLVPPIIIT